jgi:hypothetical protein
MNTLNNYRPASTNLSLPVQKCDIREFRLLQSAVQRTFAYSLGHWRGYYSRPLINLDIFIEILLSKDDLQLIKISLPVIDNYFKRGGGFGLSLAMDKKNESVDNITKETIAKIFFFNMTQDQFIKYENLISQLKEIKNHYNSSSLGIPNAPASHFKANGILNIEQWVNGLRTKDGNINRRIVSAILDLRKQIAYPDCIKLLLEIYINNLADHAGFEFRYLIAEVKKPNHPNSDLLKLFREEYPYPRTDFHYAVEQLILEFGFTAGLSALFEAVKAGYLLKEEEYLIALTTYVLKAFVNPIIGPMARNQYTNSVANNLGSVSISNEQIRFALEVEDKHQLLYQLFYPEPDISSAIALLEKSSHYVQQKILSLAEHKENIKLFLDKFINYRYHDSYTGKDITVLFNLVENCEDRRLLSLFFIKLPLIIEKKFKKIINIPDLYNSFKQPRYGFLLKEVVTSLPYVLEERFKQADNIVQAYDLFKQNNTKNEQGLLKIFFSQFPTILERNFTNMKTILTWHNAIIKSEDEFLLFVFLVNLSAIVKQKCANNSLKQIGNLHLLFNASLTNSLIQHELLPINELKGFLLNIVRESFDDAKQLLNLHKYILKKGDEDLIFTFLTHLALLLKQRFDNGSIIRVKNLPILFDSTIINALSQRQLLTLNEFGNMLFNCYLTNKQDDIIHIASQLNSSNPLEDRLSPLVASFLSSHLCYALDVNYPVIDSYKQHMRNSFPLLHSLEVPYIYNQQQNLFLMHSDTSKFPDIKAFVPGAFFDGFTLCKLDDNGKLSELVMNEENLQGFPVWIIESYNKSVNPTRKMLPLLIQQKVIPIIAHAFKGLAGFEKVEFNIANEEHTKLVHQLSIAAIEEVRVSATQEQKIKWRELDDTIINLTSLAEGWETYYSNLAQEIIKNCFGKQAKDLTKLKKQQLMVLAVTLGLLSGELRLGTSQDSIRFLRLVSGYLILSIKDFVKAEFPGICFDENSSQGILNKILHQESECIELALEPIRASKVFKTYLGELPKSARAAGDASI